MLADDELAVVVVDLDIVDIVGITGEAQCMRVARFEDEVEITTGFQPVELANRHLPIVEQQHKLNQKLRGHYAYYGVTGNSEAMNRFRQEVENRWRKWLNRRNNIRSMHWEKFCALLRRYPLAPARAMRSKLRHAANP